MLASGNDFGTGRLCHGMMNRPQPGLCPGRRKLGEEHGQRGTGHTAPEQRQAAREFTQLVLEHADQFVEWARAPEPPEADLRKAKHETALKDDTREAEHGPVLNEDVRDSEAMLRRGYSL
jgi:hypothetical protein